MEVKGDYWQCSDCGATYNEPLIGGPEEIKPTTSEVAVNGKAIKVHTYRPTPYAQRRATIARNKA